MPDREKVIKGWKCHIEAATLGCANCPYREGWRTCNFADTLYKDVYAMLKEQEAELSFRNAKPITHTATKLDDATCPSCGNVVGEKIRTGAIGQSIVQVRWDYCRFCGQKLDWEGR